MVMELAGSLQGTRWSSTAITPFGPAPGAGRGLGAFHNSGFAADPVSTTIRYRDERTGQIVEVKAPPELFLEAERVGGKGPFVVTRQPMKTGEIPSLVVRMQFTDRGAVTQQVLDSTIASVIKGANYKLSRATSFKAVDVAWKWGKIGVQASGDVPLYVPTVAGPAPYTGLRYVGSLFPAPLYEPEPQVLQRMPRQIWTYSFAVTSPQNTMTDGEGAQVLTLLKQAMVNLADKDTGASLGIPGVPITLRSCPSEVFGAPVRKPLPPAAKGAWSALLLLVAYNMVAPHIGSEVL